MKLWGGRFKGSMDPSAWKLNASLPVDQRLAYEDLRASQAWAEAIHQAGVLTAEEHARIQAGLAAIHAELTTASFAFSESDEDIHTAIERRLAELIGSLAGKLHTGRSRNDQVVTDLRLWLLGNLPSLADDLKGLQAALVERSEGDRDLLLPGYTHLQSAQPVLLSHWWLSHFWPLQRDRQRLDNLLERTSVLPLGSSALAGTPYLIDREALAAALGFRQPSQNSIDAVADRDFVVEFLFCAALIASHLSRLSEAVIVFSSLEFGFFELSDAYASGSSLMPQKHNPDVFELARAKSGVLAGNLAGFLTILKGLPSAYDKDLQEDKAPVFLAFDTLHSLLPVLAGALRTLAPHPERMRQAITPRLMATDLADYFVEKGMPFRQAHTLVGKAVLYASSLGKELDQLTLEEFRGLANEFEAVDFDPGLFSAFDPRASVARRRAMGGTSPQAVELQIQQARQILELI